MKTRQHISTLGEWLTFCGRKDVSSRRACCITREELERDDHGKWGKPWCAKCRRIALGILEDHGQ